MMSKERAKSALLMMSSVELLTVKKQKYLAWLSSESIYILSEESSNTGIRNHIRF